MTSLVPFVPRSWRDAIVIIILIAFAASGFAARALLGFDPILSLCVAFAGGLLADLGASAIAAALARERVSREELKRRLGAEASPSFVQTAAIIGCCAAAAFLVIAIAKFPPHGAGHLAFELLLSLLGGATFGTYCTTAMRQVERWSTTEAQRRPRRRLHLSLFEMVSFYMFFWSCSLAPGLVISSLLASREKSAMLFLAGYLVGGGLALRILRLTARLQADEASDRRPSANALNAVTMTAMVGLWVSTLVVMSAAIRNPSMPWDLLAALFAIAFAAPSILGLAMWASFQAKAES